MYETMYTLKFKYQTLSILIQTKKNITILANVIWENHAPNVNISLRPADV